METYELEEKEYKEKLIIKINKKIEKITAKLQKKESKQYKIKLFNKLKKKNIKQLTFEKTDLEACLVDLETKSIKEMKKNSSIRKSAEKRRMILSGNLFQTVLVICLPIALYNFFNSFYTFADAVMCSSISSDSVSKVAALGQIKSAIGAIGSGIAGGGAIVVARKYGAGEVREARKNAAVLICLGAVVSVIVAAILIPTARGIISLCQVSNITEATVTYFRLQLLELAIVAINTIFIGLEKAKGNTKLIVYLNLAVLAIKLSLTAIFIYWVRVDSIVWIELATIIGQLFMFVVGIFIMFNRKNILRVKIKDFSLRLKYVLPILKLSLPIFAGKFVMSLGKVTVNGMCGAYYNGVTDGLIVGALSVSNNLSGLVTSPTNAFEEGESTIVSQNLGARNMKRALACFWKTLIAVSIISAAGFILVRFVFLDSLVELFSSNMSGAGSELSNYIVNIFQYDCLSIPSLGLTAAVLGLLYGYGKTILSSILNFSRIGTRILTLWICHDIFGLGYEAAGISMGISNIVIFILALIFLMIFYCNIKKKGYNGMHVGDPEPEMIELDI